jgi:hypothetical protein
MCSNWQVRTGSQQRCPDRPRWRWKAHRCHDRESGAITGSRWTLSTPAIHHKPRGGLRDDTWEDTPLYIILIKRHINQPGSARWGVYIITDRSLGGVSGRGKRRCEFGRIYGGLGIWFDPAQTWRLDLGLFTAANGRDRNLVVAATDSIKCRKRGRGSLPYPNVHYPTMGKRRATLPVAKPRIPIDGCRL